MTRHSKAGMGATREKPEHTCIHTHTHHPRYLVGANAYEPHASSNDRSGRQASFSTRSGKISGTISPSRFNLEVVCQIHLHMRCSEHEQNSQMPGL